MPSLREAEEEQGFPEMKSVVQDVQDGRFPSPIR